MGIEIETSVIKVRPGKGSQTYMMNIFTSKQAPWTFTSDTLDNSLQSSKSKWMNTESKTYGGASRWQVLKSLEEMTMTWKILLEKCRDHTETVLQQREINEAFEIEWENHGSKPVEIWTPFLTQFQQKRLAYPQLTYSLPLALLPNIFAKIVGFTEKEASYEKKSDLVRFASASTPTLNMEFNELDDADLNSMWEKETRPITKHRILTELNHRSQKALLVCMKPIRDAPISAARGLAYLFSFYVYQLFCKNPYIRENEPGPKLMLGIMSRVPFSTMYRSLSDQDRDQFKNLIELNLRPFFSNVLRLYKTTNFIDGKYVDLQESERIKLEEWYNSIVIGDGADLLSPPPGCRSCSPAYGMGAYSGDGIPSDFGLVEVRGYSKLKINGQEITIDNVEKLIKDEINWFFSL